MKKYYILALMLFFLIKTYAQEINEAITKPSTIRLGVEMGYDYFWAEAKHLDRTYIRTMYPRPTTDFQNMNIAYVGVKPEFLFAKNRFGVATGIRISQYHSKFEVSRSEVVAWFGGENFVWVYDDDYNNLPLLNINQKSCFVGIPLELKCFLTKKDKLFQPYIKSSAGFNFLIHTKNDLEVWRSELEGTNIYNGEKFTNIPGIQYPTQGINIVQQQMGKPAIFNVRTSLALGLKIGRSKYPFGNIEIHIPIILNAKSVSPFVVPNAGLGFQCSLQIPLKNHIKQK